MRRNSERLFKRSTKVVQTELRKFCEFWKTELLTQVFLNVVSDRAFLPPGEPSPAHALLANDFPVDAR